MRAPLFVKTLLWFLVTAIATMLALFAAASMNWNPGEQRHPPLGMLFSLQMGEARAAYERGGQRELRAVLERFQRITTTSGALTDGQGRDLLTGEIRPEIGARPPRRVRFALFRRPPPYIARRSTDGAYGYVMTLHRGNWMTWFLGPEDYLPVLAVILVLCYAFARHLTSPVRALQRAVDRFGSGDFAARVASRRRDELGKLGRAFDQMADRIQTLLAAERRLLLDISHELRSPLARLSVAVELARSSDDPEIHLNRIEKEAGRLNALVGELLQVTRAEGDAATAKAQRIDLSGLVQAIAGDAAIEAESRGCSLQVDAPERVWAKGDPELLRRAIENVIRNAVRYTPEGQPVAISVQTRADGAAITVRDFGPGVPRESLERIFDAFYRVDSDRSRVSGGAGLGLSIARRAVELHKGRISASNADPGLLVEIHLPSKP